MKIIRNVLIGIICISLVVGGYYYLSNRKTAEETDISEVQKVILKELEALKEMGYAMPEKPQRVNKQRK